MIKIPKSLDELKNLITDHGILDTVKANAAKIMQSSSTEPSANEGAAALEQLKTLIQQQLNCVKTLGQYIEGLNNQLAQLQAKISQLEPPAPPPTAIAAEPAVDAAPASESKDEK